MGIDLDQVLEEHEYDELGALLDARLTESGLQLDGLQGLITAVAIGPEPVPPDEWMAHVLDEGQPFESVQQAERAISLVLRLYNSVAQDLEDLHYEPILGQIDTESGETTLSAHGWCEGFSIGVDLRCEQWESRMKDDVELMKVLEPILKLSGDEGVFETEPGEEPAALSEIEYEESLAKLATSVYDVQQYWRDHPPDAPFTPRPGPEGPSTARGIPRRRGGHTVH